MSKNITWVGIDVHAHSLVVAVLEGEEQRARTQRLPNEWGVVRKVMGKWSTGRELRVCYEAGPTGYGLCRRLRGMGISCEVIAPSLVPRRAGDRVKTDRRDATNLARLFRAGELTPIRVPTPKEEAVRNLVRAREAVRVDLMRSRNRLGKLLLREGRTWPARKRTWTKEHRAWIWRQRFPEKETQASFDWYLGHVDYLEGRQRDIESRILEVAQEEPWERGVRVLTSFRGIRELASMLLQAEVFDFRRFGSAEELAGFSGLVPRESSSGGKVRRGQITRTGNATVRRVVVEAAWAYRLRPNTSERLRRAHAQVPPGLVAMSHRAMNRLHRRYQDLVRRGKRSPVAVTAVARELLGFLWAAMVEYA